MDENPFSILKSNCDILFVYDYKTPDFGEFDFSKYEDIKLLAFSYGVYASSIAQLPKDLVLSSAVAVSGTLIPVDDVYGVPFRQFELTEKMNSETIVKFRERLFGGKKGKAHFEIFENNLPNRSATSCTEELIGMKKYVPLIPANKCIFSKVIVTTHDRCIPSKNQMNFWKKINFSNIIEFEAGHFPFYNYRTFEEFFDD